MRKIFKDDDLDTQLKSEGYVLIQEFFDDNRLSELRKVFEGVEQWDGRSFFTTQWLEDKKQKSAIHNELKLKLSNRLRELLVSYRDIFSYFMIKKSKDESFSHVHQDWTLVDEEKFVGLNIWGPLVDVDEHNGALGVLPKSHLKYTQVRGTDIPQSFDPVELKNTETLLNIKMKAGDILFFDHRLVHASSNNSSDTTRASVGTVLIPDEADLLHYYMDINKITKMRVDDNFLLKHSFGENIRKYAAQTV